MRILRSLLFLSVPFFLAGQQRSMTIDVIAPNDSFRGSPIYITGNQLSLGGWNPSKIPLIRENDSIWKITVGFPEGEHVEYKITRGSWETEAIYEKDIVPGNNILIVQNDTTIILKPHTWRNLIEPAKASMRHSQSIDTIIGTVRYHHGLKGKNLRYDRDVIVWLPPSYATNNRKCYPVLYMHDGQNIFNPATAYTGYDWRVDEVADSLIAKKRIEEIIVVGIYNTADRLPEYSDSKPGHAYAEFIVKKLKPMIDSHYRTKPGRRNTAVMGSSMGGLISFLVAWWYPDVFGMAGCLSSSFMYDDDKVLADVRGDRRARKKVKFYIDCGGKEKELLPGYHEMIKLLTQKGYRKGIELETYIEPAGVHNEQAWSRRLSRPLVFMFGRE